MRIDLTDYDDSLTVVTAHGTEIDISVTECKTRLGVAGTTDQIHIATRQPIAVKHYPRNPTDAALHSIRIGEDHFLKEMRIVEPDWVEDPDDDPDVFVYETPQKK